LTEFETGSELFTAL